MWRAALKHDEACLGTPEWAQEGALMIRPATALHHEEVMYHAMGRVGHTFRDIPVCPVLPVFCVQVHFQCSKLRFLQRTLRANQRK